MFKKIKNKVKIFIKYYKLFNQKPESILLNPCSLCGSFKMDIFFHVTTSRWVILCNNCGHSIEHGNVSRDEKHEVMARIYWNQNNPVVLTYGLF